MEIFHFSINVLIDRQCECKYLSLHVNRCVVCDQGLSTNTNHMWIISFQISKTHSIIIIIPQVHQFTYIVSYIIIVILWLLLACLKTYSVCIVLTCTSLIDHSLSILIKTLDWNVLRWLILFFGWIRILYYFFLSCTKVQHTDTTLLLRSPNILKNNLEPLFDR